MGLPNYPKVQIECMQTVTPVKVSEPKHGREILMEEHSNKADIFKWRQNMLLYYKSKTDGRSGWYFAGWSVESLGRALSEQPLLAGRLTHRSQGHRGHAIVPNDSGVRLIQAKIAITLPEFLNLNEKAGADSAEADLVYWEDIDENIPQFCPLLYIQVTNFQCGGYAIGISCSLLVADLLIMRFLNRWAEIHRVIIGSSSNGVFKTPLFYYPNLKPPGSSPTENHCRSPCSNNNGCRTVIFNVVAESLNLDEALYKQLASLCVEEAETNLGYKMASGFSFFKKEDSREVMRVELCTKQMGHYNKQLPGIKWKKMTQTSWDDLGVQELNFHEGDKPALVSCWNVGSPSEGLVMAIASAKDGLSGIINLMVTFQNEEI